MVFAFVSTDKGDARAGVMEIRAAADPAKSWRIDYGWPWKWTSKSHNKRLGAGDGWWPGATYALADRGPVPELPPGQYRMAWTLDGQRRSNVMPLRIDPDFDYASVPLVELIPVEPGPDAPFTVVGVRVFRHRETDPAFRPFHLAFARQEVNGKDVTRGCCFFGHDAPLAVGGHYTSACVSKAGGNSPALFLPGDTFRATVCGISSEPVVVDATARLASIWDAWQQR
jgi:hypothetical protein